VVVNGVRGWPGSRSPGEYTHAPKRFSRRFRISIPRIPAPVPGAGELASRRVRLCELIRAAAPAVHGTSATAWWAPEGKQPFGPALVLVRGAPPSTSNFRQWNDLYYLAGIEVPNAYLEIDARDGRSVLYLPRRNEGWERSAGPRLSADDADAVTALSGVDEVRPLEELPVVLGRRVTRRLAPVVFTPLAPAEGFRGARDGELAAGAEALVDPFAGAGSRESAFADALRVQLPTLDVRDASPFLDELRSVKSEYEISMMREAGRLTGLAVLEAMRATAPGVREYELGAIAELVFLRGGAFGSAYEPIVAAGANIWHGHYGAKTSELEPGQLVLMDAAPDYRYYTSDIGRMWPVTGTWEPWQLELYGFVARYHVELLARIRPGVTSDDVLSGAAEVMSGVLEETGFSKPAYEQAAREAIEFPYHLSHPVGMSVHDVGEYRGRPFVPGHVFSVDPMLWVPDERLYVRCEDTVVVTEDGIENLTGFVPIDPDEIARVMREPGLLEVLDAR
jgi:Xaa-Pro aminopeptidase